MKKTNLSHSQTVKKILRHAYKCSEDAVPEHVIDACLYTAIIFHVNEKGEDPKELIERLLKYWTDVHTLIKKGALNSNSY